MKKLIKFLVASLIVVIVGGAIGYSSALLSDELIVRQGAVKNGPWLTDLTIGSREAGMHLRFFIAKHTLLALAKSETIYYTASTDDAGEPLRSDCDYRIEGRPLDARWWSITVYGEDDFLIPNSRNRYSYTMNNLAYGADGSYRICLSRTPKEGNWLLTGDKLQNLSITLRLYNPGQAFYQNPGTVELPHIIKEKCR